MREPLNKIIKYLLYSLELLLFYNLSCTVNLIPSIFGVTPMLLMVSAVTIALLESEISSIGIGVFAGFLIDLSFGNFFGLFACVMSVICCLVSVITKDKNKVTLFSASKIGVVSLLVCVLCDWFFRYICQNYSSIFVILINNYLPIYLYSLLCLPLIYLINLGIYNGFKFVKEM
ncbi:MAG: rod shape-determining protein MreD [Clostridia bacterium]